MPPPRRSQSYLFGIDPAAVVAAASRPHKRKKNPTKKQQEEEERQQQIKAAKELQKQQEKERIAEERRLAQERRDNANQQTETNRQAAQLEKERQQQEDQAKEAAIAKRQHRVAAGLPPSPRGSDPPSPSQSSLPYRDVHRERINFKNFLRLRQEAGPEVDDRIMTDEVEAMEDELQVLKQAEWTANPDLTISGTMRLGHVQHWSTSFETTFREFDMTRWGSELQAVWELGH